MKKFNIILDKIKNDNFLRIMVELVILLLFYNINIYIGLALLLIILFEIVISKNIDNLLYVFLFLSFNDDVLIFDLINGSISRIVMIVILLKLLYFIIKNKITINKKYIFITLFFFISSIINLTNYLEVGIVFLNIFIFILFSISISYSVKNKDELIEKLCLTIVVSVICSIIYGLATANFLVYMQNDKIMYRFNGTYEPNFMCMYINLAILSLITIKKKMKKIFYYLIFAFLINSVLLTISITGIATLIFCIILYVFLFHKEWKKIITHALYIIIISSVMFLGVNGINKEEYMNLIKGNVNNISSEDINDNNEGNNDIENDNYNLIDGKDNVKSDDNHDKKENIVDSNDNLIDAETNVKNGDSNDNKGNIKDRIERINELLSTGKIDELTSGRTALVRTFFYASFNRPVLEILFGNNILNKKLYSSFFDKECYSHNTYIDFLYNFGIIGFCIIIGYIGYITINNKFTNEFIIYSQYAKNIKLIRLMLLLYALSLTLYTKRMFLIFFLL